MSRRRVVVIGGGITGLAAADALLAVSDDVRPDVVLLEAEPTLGGKVRTSPFDGLPAVDEGPDAFLARVPWATALARAGGLGDQLVSPTSGSAAVWWERLHPIPAGLVLGLPTDLGRLAGTHLISWRGKARAATELFRRRTSLDDDSIGAFVRSRFGDEVHERLVDPLVGSIYAADTDRFSLAAVPQLDELARSHRSILLGSRSRGATAPTGPGFYAPSGGMADLISAVARRVTDHGGTIRTGTPASPLRPDGLGWRVGDEYADAVVLACPAVHAAHLLQLTDVAPAVAAELSRIEYADVAMVTMSVDLATWPERMHGMSGYLVPKPVQQLVTAVSFGSQKWAHWARPDSVLLRISLGRDGRPVDHLTDDQLIDAAVTETSRHLGVTLVPTAARTTMWHRAFPQYRPHHHERIARISESLPPTLALAGASYHGIGIPACVRSGQGAAAAVTATLRHP